MRSNPAWDRLRAWFALGSGGGMDSPIHGMDMASPSIDPLPIRLEVRNGTLRPAVYDVNGEEFLIGSVPGCDLRLPGTNLPPVVCLIARQPDGIRLRKLAPTLPVLVNGQPITQTATTRLTNGDCISIGAIDLVVAVDFMALPAPVPAFISGTSQSMDFRAVPSSFNQREQELTDRERKIGEQTRELESDRILWYRRRDEIEQEVRKARESSNRFDRSGDDLAALENRMQVREEELNRRQSEFAKNQDELLKLKEETLSTRRELHDRITGKRDELANAQDSIRESLANIRKREEGFEAELAIRRQAFEDELKQRRQLADAELRQWHNRGASGLTHLREQVEQELSAKNRQRAEELDRFQLSLREAAVQLRERKQLLDDDMRQFEPRRGELIDLTKSLDRKQEELDLLQTELQRERTAIDIDRRMRNEPILQREIELAEREAELERLQKRFDADGEIIEKGKSQYRADLIRLDRWQVTLDEKEQALEARAAEIDRRYSLFQRDTGDLEDQVLQIDAHDEQFKAEEQRQGKQRAEIEKREAKLNERLAQIEGQQAMLAALRTRLEHVRVEQREESSRIADERARLETHALEAQENLRDAERLREELSSQQIGQGETERVFKERSEILQQAVGRLRELQQQVSAEDDRLRQRGEELETKAADLAEHDGLLKAKTEQLLEHQHRLDADRLALKQREESIFLTEGTRESLQDQLRRRNEDLMAKGRELDARSAEIEEQSRQVAEQRESLELQRSESTDHRQQVEGHAAALVERDEQLRQAEEAIAVQRKQFEEARARWEEQQRLADEATAQARQEIEELKRALSTQAADLFNQVPDLEARSQAALDRTAQARESLRAQLTELHAYTRQNQEDLERVRTQVQTEIERLRQQESGLNRARAEHRHAVASFRQQLIEWQARFSGMKQALSHGESRIERREKVIEATSQELAKQAEQLEVRQREVAERRGEMERHLNDMREWYRKKFKELVENRGQGSGVRGREDHAIIPLPVNDTVTDNEQRTTDNGQQVILSINDDLDPSDRKFGELMQSLELVDAETLMVLWSEARRQHRPLRQVLLAGGYLTLYQLALIETGNLDGLVLGRFRVVDRLHSTVRESIYRVFDPQGATVDRQEQANCLLRHLGEAEMQDAVRPDEYRQRFGAARDVAHPNIAATREVIEINGRPAVVQDWLSGLTGSEFPSAAGVPGVWFRLLSQAALGLHTAHQAGLIHGRLTSDSFLLTREGTLKIMGLGEPHWLHPNLPATEWSAEDDLRALGQIVLKWSQLVPKRKSKKGLPDGLLGILRGLGAETNDGIPLALYPSMAALLEDLDHVSAEVPPDSAAWEKLLEHIAVNATEGPLLRQSA